MKTYFRPMNEATLGGVCAGIAKYFNVNVTLVRILFLLFLNYSLTIYLITWLATPEK